MKLKMMIGVVVFAFSMTAFAQVKAPATGGTATLSCPAGSKLIGGPKSVLEASVCVRMSRDGSRIFHGPYVAYWANGVKQAEGQYDNGFRSGHWTFFDEKGVKTGETNFNMDNYDGLRIEFWPNGQKKLEETYRAGRREGAQIMFDQTGKVISKVDFSGDRPVGTR